MPVRARADAERRDARPDDVARPRHGEGIRAPGRSRLELGEDLADGAVVVDGVAEEAAAVAGDVVGGADDLHAEAGVAAEFPEDAAADLRALAVIAREFHERMALLREHALEFDVDRRHFQLPAAGTAQAVGDERDRVEQTLPARDARGGGFAAFGSNHDEDLRG